MSSEVLLSGVLLAEHDQFTGAAAAEPRQTAVASGDLKEFVAANKMPPTIEFNDNNSQKIFNAGIPQQVCPVGLVLWRL